MIPGNTDNSTLDKLLNLYVTSASVWNMRFVIVPSLQNFELICIKCLDQCLTHNKYFLNPS